MDVAAVRVSQGGGIAGGDAGCRDADEDEEDNLKKKGKKELYTRAKWLPCC